MRTPTLAGHLRRAAPACLVALLYGCAASPDASSGSGRAAAAGSDSSGEPVSTYIDARPAALVDGQSVSWGELRPTLTEIGGAEALDEYILDVQLAKALKQAGQSVGASDVERERQLLIDQLADDPNRALRLLDELRARRNLGPRRFDALLRRNASLRKLVQSRIEVTPAMEQQQFELLYGMRRQARIIVLPSLYDAQQAVEALARQRTTFNDLAVTESTDSSASRGGLLEPISRADATYPEALRRALWDLEPGEVSRPILLENDYALLRLERVIPGPDVPFDEVRHEMSSLARLSQERFAMDRLALDLVSNVQITIFDDSLNDSWRMARRSRDASPTFTSGGQP